MNDKLILMECFRSFLNLKGLVVTKADAYLNKPAAKSCMFV